MASDREARKLKRYLSDIVTYGESVVEKLSDVTLERFSGDIDLLHVVAYRLQCVSEATKNALVSIRKSLHDIRRFLGRKCELWVIAFAMNTEMLEHTSFGKQSEVETCAPSSM